MSACTIDLSPTVEKSLVELAAQRSLSVEEYMLEVLEEVAEGYDTRAESSENGSDAVNQKPVTGRELLEKWRREGLLWRTDMTEDTVEYAHKLRERTQRRDLGRP